MSDSSITNFYYNPKANSLNFNLCWVFICTEAGPLSVCSFLHLHLLFWLSLFSLCWIPFLPDLFPFVRHVISRVTVHLIVVFPAMLLIWTRFSLTILLRSSDLSAYMTRHMPASLPRADVYTRTHILSKIVMLIILLRFIFAIALLMFSSLALERFCHLVNCTLWSCLRCLSPVPQKKPLALSSLTPSQINSKITDFFVFRGLSRIRTTKQIVLLIIIIMEFSGLIAEPVDRIIPLCKKSTAQDHPLRCSI